MTVRRLLFAFTFTLLITSAHVSAAQELPERRLGDRPPTPEEQAYIDAVYTEVTRVAPNDLARARVWAEIDAAVARGERAPAPDGLPTIVDNSTLQYFPPIDSQGNQGSCTCWAACYYYNTYTQAVDEGYDVSGGDPDHICSPGFMYPLVNGGVDAGAVTQLVVARLNEVGCSSWTLKPYSDLDYTSWPSETAWVNALQNRTQTAHTINGSTQPGLDAIKQHLANGNLAATRFTVYSTWHIYYADNSKTGIDNDVYYYPDGPSVGGHAVTLVGYDDTKSYVDHRDAQTHYGAFLLANSWGNGWGVQNSTGSGTNGFFWVAYDMFLESTFGPNAYYNDDRADYRPALYAVVGVNHPERWDVILQGAVDSSPDWQSYYPIYYDGGSALPVTDADRIAIDLTDGIPSIPSSPPTTAFARVYDYPTSSYDATITSADFYEDFDGDGIYALDSSTDPTVTINPATWGYAYAVIHDFSVSALDPSPSTVPSGGSASLSATYWDSDGHGVASWSWDDAGAGGSFSPSADVQNPTYTAPANSSGSDVIITLTVNATCDGSVPLSDSDSTTLTVQPEPYPEEVVTEAWRGGGFHDCYSVSVNPTDNSCWVADMSNSQVVHLAPSPYPYHASYPQRHRHQNGAGTARALRHSDDCAVSAFRHSDEAGRGREAPGPAGVTCAEHRTCALSLERHVQAYR